MRRGDELARRRQELPWIRIDKEYQFETDEGSASLADLFRGRSQLLIYHFMFGYGFRLTDERRGCTGCSLIADHFDGVIPHLNGRDITLVCKSIAPLQELQDYKQQMGWRFPWVSSLGSDFKYDFGAAFTEEQRRNGADYNYQHIDKPEPQKEGMSVFALQGGAVHHAYSTYARGTEALMGAYSFLDLAPWGRNEDGIETRGGAATTSTASAEPSRGCRWHNKGTGDLTTHGFRASFPASSLGRRSIARDPPRSRLRCAAARLPSKTSAMGQCLTNRSTSPISEIGPEADLASHNSTGF